MRFGKPDIEIQSSGQLDMAGHCRSAIVSQALTQKCRQLLHQAREALQGALGRATAHTA
jgi:hypothetical protein